MTADTRPLLYLDIDGVLLRRRHRSVGLFDAFEVAPGCLDFLTWAVANYRCRWLSSRCRQGWPDGSRRAFRLAGADLKDARWAVLDAIKPAVWRINKTEAIDPGSDFWWVEDDPTGRDRAWLAKHDRLDRLIEVSADRDPDALIEARHLLEIERVDPRSLYELEDFPLGGASE